MLLNAVLIFPFSSDTRAARYSVSRRLSFGSMYVCCDVCSSVLTTSVIIAMKKTISLRLLPQVNDREYFFLGFQQFYMLLSLSFKAVDQQRKLCTRQKMVWIIALAPLLKKGMLGLLVLFVDAHPLSINPSSAKSSLTRISKSGHVPPSPNSSQVAIVKSEALQVDDDKVLQSPSVKKGKEKPTMRFSSPIVISSDENDVPTPKAKIAEKSNVKKAYV